MAFVASTSSKQISGVAYNVIEKIAQKCVEEKKNKKLKYPLEEPLLRVVYYTGASVEYVKKIHSKTLSSDDKKEEFCASIFDRQLIYKALEKIYEMELTPTVLSLKQECNLSLPMPLFKHMIKRMAYEIKTLENGSEILVESPDIAYDRFNYLKKVTKARQLGKDIYYVDERYIDAKMEFPRPWAFNKTEENSKELVEGYIFFSVVSKFGFNNGIFCNQMVTKDLEKWMIDIILPTLKKSSVIILENSSHHMPTTEKAIKKSDNKEVFIRWLRKNNIPYSSDMHKAELYDLIEKFWKPEINYDIDEVLKAHGHQVLRLPQSLYDLTISDLMWNYSKSLLAQEYDNNTLVKLKLSIRDHLYNLYSNKWVEFDDTIQDLEKQLYDIEIRTDQALQKYKFGDPTIKISVEVDMGDVECIEIS